GLFHSPGSTKGDTAMIREHSVPKELDTLGCRIEPGLEIAKRMIEPGGLTLRVRPPLSSDLSLGYNGH
ncbi:MAG: hypothetical protein ACOYM2_21950, partial [Rectinemataceae bacterium]